MIRWQIFTFNIVLTLVTTQFFCVSTFNIIIKCSHNISFTSFPQIFLPNSIIPYQLLLKVMSIYSVSCDFYSIFVCVLLFFLFHLKLNLSIEKNNIEFVFYGSKLVKNKHLIDRSQKFDFRFFGKCGPLYLQRLLTDFADKQIRGDNFASYILFQRKSN